MAARIGRGSCFKVGTAGALDLIPKDVILCPWHYEKMPAYPSLPLLLEKGFRVLPASWRKLDASRALIEYSQKHASPRMLAHRFTTWSGSKDTLPEYAPLVEGVKLLHGPAFRINQCNLAGAGRDPG